MLNPPTYVVGLDISLASTGIAKVFIDGSAHVRTVESGGKRDATLADRANRIRTVAEEVCRHIVPVRYGDTVQILIESPAYGLPGGSVWDRAGLWWAVVLRLHTFGLEVNHAAAGTVKKWITGSGSSKVGKNTVGVHVGRLFPDVEIGNDDEADALAMAHLLAVRAGYPVITLAGHTPDLWVAVKWADQ